MDSQRVGTLVPPVQGLAATPRGGARIQSPWAALGSCLERRPRYFLTLFALVYSVVTLAHAQRRFWYDELFTYYICRLPHMSDVFRALADGLDFNPPLLYITTRLSWQAFGVSPMTTRVPETIGFGVFCLCVFVFTRRRAGTVFAFAAMCFPPITAAYGYASEARPYGLVMGFCGLAAVCWQSATSARRRKAALAGLALAAAGLALSHCYSVLIFVAFAAAELLRLFRRRRADWALWLCLFGPLSVAFVWLYLPMLHNVKAYVVNSVSFHPGLGLAPRFFSFLLNNQSHAFEKRMIFETVWPLLAALAASCLARRDHGDTAEPRSSADLPSHELAFLFALGLLPVFGNILAVFTRAPFIDRYALSAVFGVAVLLSCLAARASAGNRSLGAGLAALFSVWFMAGFVLWFASLFAEPKFYDFPIARLADLPPGVPIVISDPLMFLEADYYEPPAVAERLRFVTDRESALRFTGTDMFDRGYYTMRRWFPLKGQLADYHDFLATQKRFYVYGPFDDPEDWLLRKLTQENAHLVLKGQFRRPGSHGDDNVLLEVNLSSR